jgi:hypothetical protein
MDVTDDRQYCYFFFSFCSFNNIVTLGYKVGLKKKSYLFTVPLFLTPPHGQPYPHTESPTLIHAVSGIDGGLRSALVVGALSAAPTTCASRKTTALTARWALASGDRNRGGLQLRQPARRGELRAPAVRRHAGTMWVVLGINHAMAASRACARVCRVHASVGACREAAARSSTSTTRSGSRPRAQEVSAPPPCVV